VGRQGLVAILLRKIVARPCSRDCSGNPFCRPAAKRLKRKARFLARERQKGAHLFFNLLTLEKMDKKMRNFDQKSVPSVWSGGFSYSSA
jgi:hypothetical protein